MSDPEVVVNVPPIEQPPPVPDVPAVEGQVEGQPAKPKRGRKRKSEAAISAEGEAVSLAFDKYEIVEMHRSELKAAEYNPRIMSDEALAKLRTGIKRHGMLQPPIWNKRSGNIVGGHQRLKALDALAGSPNYTLQVAVVDLDPSVEKEANVLLNNPQAQGDWDLEKLEAIFADTAVVLDGTGFDMSDLYRLLGDAPGRNSEDLEQLGEALSSLRSNYDEVLEKAKTRDDFYLVVVFRDYETRKALLDFIGWSDNRYQDGAKLLKLLGFARPAAEKSEGNSEKSEGNSAPATTANANV